MPTILDLYEKTFEADFQLYQQAQSLFPDGVTHDLRYDNPHPVYIERATKSRKWTASGYELIDFWSGHGSLLLGHNPPNIIRAIEQQLQLGTHYGACHHLELEWASRIIDLVPSAERIRFTSSGTEATQMALRLARLFTKKSKVVKFAGHYHGWHDGLIQSYAPPYDRPIAGIPPNTAATTIVCPPNDLEVLTRLFTSDEQIAAVILEPTGGSFGAIPTDGNFLHQLRKLTTEYGVLMIFDEVITGFRVAPGGAQAYYQVKPDLTTLAKIMAGGLPGGAVTGRAEIIDLISKEKSQRMPHQGTFNANPVSASAGIEMLKVAGTGKPQEKANQTAAQLRKELNKVIDLHNLDWAFYGEFSAIRFLLGHGGQQSATTFNPYELDYRELKGASNPELVINLRAGMRLNGVDLMPSGGMTTAGHSHSDVEQTVGALDKTIRQMKVDGVIS